MVEFIPYRKSKERSHKGKYNKNKSTPEFTSPHNVVKAVNVYRSVTCVRAKKNIVFDANLSKKK